MYIHAFLTVKMKVLSMIRPKDENNWNHVRKRFTQRMASVARVCEPCQDPSSSKDRVLFDNQEETVNWIAVESLSRQSGGLLIDLFLMSPGRWSSRFVHVQIPGSIGRERVIRNDNETLIGRRLASMLRPGPVKCFPFRRSCHRRSCFAD